MSFFSIVREKKTSTGLEGFGWTVECGIYTLQDF